MRAADWVVLWAVLKVEQLVGDSVVHSAACWVDRMAALWAGARAATKAGKWAAWMAARKADKKES